MTGPAIGFIIIGSALYRFRRKWGMPSSPHAERIGFAFWWGGWSALLWSMISLFFGYSAPLSYIGMVVATFWVGLVGIGVSYQLIHNNNPNP